MVQAAIVTAEWPVGPGVVLPRRDRQQSPRSTERTRCSTVASVTNDIVWCSRASKILYPGSRCEIEVSTRCVQGYRFRLVGGRLDAEYGRVALKGTSRLSENRLRRVRNEVKGVGGHMLEFPVQRWAISTGLCVSGHGVIGGR